jgi:hypothetical protein
MTKPARNPSQNTPSNTITVGTLTNAFCSLATLQDQNLSQLIALCASPNAQGFADAVTQLAHEWNRTHQQQLIDLNHAASTGASS